jgi:hypothetical protein
MLLCLYFGYDCKLLFPSFCTIILFTAQSIESNVGIHETLILSWLPFTMLDKDPHEILSSVVGFYRYELQKQIHSMS